MMSTFSLSASAADSSSPNAAAMRGLKRLGLRSIMPDATVTLRLGTPKGPVNVAWKDGLRMDKNSSIASTLGLH